MGVKGVIEDGGIIEGGCAQPSDEVVYRIVRNMERPYR